MTTAAKVFLVQKITALDGAALLGKECDFLRVPIVGDHVIARNDACVDLVTKVTLIDLAHNDHEACVELETIGFTDEPDILDKSDDDFWFDCLGIPGINSWLKYFYSEGYQLISRYSFWNGESYDAARFYRSEVLPGLMPAKPESTITKKPWRERSILDSNMPRDLCKRLAYYKIFTFGQIEEAGPYELSEIRHLGAVSLRKIFEAHRDAGGTNWVGLQMK